MSGAGTRTGVVTAPSRAERQARWLMVAVGLVFLIPPTVFVIVDFDMGGPLRRWPDIIAGILLATAVGAIHFRHSLAAAAGTRPAAWPWTLLALLLLVYLPFFWWQWDWLSLQGFVVASAAMLLPGRVAAVVAPLPVVGTAAVAWWHAEVAVSGLGVYFGLYWLAGLLLSGVCLYGAARLVLLVSRLQTARAELAEAAIGRERTRVSRDLHDLLGQSLSAVSLKGDLALALLHRDPAGARAEIEGLTTVARSALRDIRAVTSDEHLVSLRAELDGAVALLSATGVRADVQVDVRIDGQDSEAPAGQLLAWAVREGTTNVLRHSEARTCTIAVGHRNGTIQLEMINDGVLGPGGTGSGLAGLADRARALSGSVRAGPQPHGRFRLLVEVPGPAPHPTGGRERA